MREIGRKNGWARALVSPAAGEHSRRSSADARRTEVGCRVTRERSTRAKSDKVAGAASQEGRMGIGMMAQWKGFKPNPDLIRTAAEFMVMLAPYADVFQNCEVVVEAQDTPVGGQYNAVVRLELDYGTAGPMHADSPNARDALLQAFQEAKAHLDSIPLPSRHRVP